MFHSNPVFNAYIPSKMITLLLIFALFPHLMLLGLFNMNTTFTASFLDMEVEDLQFLFSMAYATIVCALFFHTRLFAAFNIRNYLILMTLLNIVLLLLMTMTKDSTILFALRFIQGPLSLFEGCILLPLLISNIKSKQAKFIAYSVLYAYMMTSDKINTSLVKFAIQHYYHEMILYVVIAFHVLALLCYLIVFNSNRMFPKKPLYQMNIGAGILLVISLLCGAFAAIYGKKYEWFDSYIIVLTISSCFIFSALFLLHQRTSKRRLYDFEVLKSERVILGLLLFFILYLLRAAMPNVYQVMQLVWHWHWEYILQIQYYNVLGSLLGIIISYYLYIYTQNYKVIFLISFMVLGISMYGFTLSFTLHVQLMHIVWSLFLQGLGQGFLFTPLVFFMIGSVPASISASAAQSGTAIRFWASTLGFAIMQNALLYLNNKNQYSLSQNLIPTNPIFQQDWSQLMIKYSSTNLYENAIKMSYFSIQQQVYNQALLLSNIEIFSYLVLLSFIVVLAILLYKPLKTMLWAYKK